MSKDEVDRILKELICQQPEETPPKPPPELRQPRCVKAKISIWADMQMKDANQILDSTSLEELQKILAEIFNLKNYKENKRCAILMDFYTYIAKFAKENCFNAEQTSALFSIFKRTHELCIETPFDNFCHCFQFFKEMVICHSVRRPPFSIDLFSPEEGKKIMEYGINSYFRHFKLYKYVFTQRVTMDLKLNYNGIPVTPPTFSPRGEMDEKVAELVKNQEEDMKNAEVTSELKSLIRKHLTDELKQLKTNMEEQIKRAEEEIGRRLEIPEAVKPAGKAETKAHVKEKKHK